MIATSGWRRLALVLAALAAFAAGLSLAAASHDSPATALRSAYGVSVDLPTSWVGRIYDIGRGNPTLAALQAGTFAGSEDPDVLKADDDIATGATKIMHPGDVLILLWEATPAGGGFDYEPLVGKPEIRPADLGVALEGFPLDHAVGRRFFSTGCRYFDLMVEFGTASPGADDLARANEILRTLRIEPSFDARAEGRL